MLTKADSSYLIQKRFRTKKRKSVMEHLFLVLLFHKGPDCPRLQDEDHHRQEQVVRFYLLKANRVHIILSIIRGAFFVMTSYSSSAVIMIAISEESMNIKMDSSCQMQQSGH